MQTRPSLGLRTLLAIGGLCALLAACVPPGPPGPEPGQVERARSLAAAGEHLEAARAWQSVADVSAGPARDRALIEAARAWREAGRTREADAALSAVAEPPTGEAGVEYRLLAAELAVLRGRDEDALELLSGLPDELDAARKATALDLEGRAWLGRGRAGEAVASLVERERWLRPEALPDNRRRIWNRLQEAAAAGADLTPPRGASPVVVGWLELGSLLAAYGRDAGALQTALAAWQAAHPAHPASARVIDEALAGFRDLAAYPRRLALLLPLSGRLDASAAAIRDGFIAAWFAQAGDEERPEVLVLDTAQGGAAAAREQAVAQGAGFIVGPLQKEEVEALARSAGGIPTLALNEIGFPMDLPATFYRFGLSPEDEAAAAARRVLADGLYRGIALVPQGDWGMRVAAAFGESLQSGGGRLVDVATYQPGGTSHGETISSLLHLDDSIERHRRLEAALGTRLEFEPRRRQDAQFVFLAAQAADARQLKPQLNFHYASDLPVYATSAIYEPGEPASVDLQGVRFGDMPWVLGGSPAVEALRDQVSSTRPGAYGRRARLFALGYDAYRLVPLLTGERARLRAGVPALTGTLVLEESGRIRRELGWAVIEDGHPVHLAQVPGDAG